MKYRLDFVTNSSSSSFLIAKKNLDEDQLEAIRNHSELGKKLNLQYAEEAWHIDENENYITGYTYMDNFYISELFDIIGVNNKSIHWSEYEQKLPTDDLEDENNGSDYNTSNWRDILKTL
jgi:hypothetical protein